MVGSHETLPLKFISHPGNKPHMYTSGGGALTIKYPLTQATNHICTPQGGGTHHQVPSHPGNKPHMYTSGGGALTIKYPLKKELLFLIFQSSALCLLSL